MDWYRISAKEVFKDLETSEKGLTDEEVKKRLLKYGPNTFAKDEGISKLGILLNQFKNPLIYILILAGIVTTYFQEYIDSGVIFGVVVLNAVVGFAQEFKAEESARALKKMLVPVAHVVRNGKEDEVNSEELVPGDIVYLESGDRVPADIRLFRTIEFRIDEALLTGESVPANKVTDAISKENLTPGDQRNMAFMGTIVVGGRGRGIVVGTGSSTTLGKIAQDVKEIGYVKTPLQEKFDHFAHQIGFIVLFACSILIAAGMMSGLSFKDMFTTAVAAAVAAIPEGLPIVVTIAMAIGVSRMARRNAIVRKLPAVETLGSTTVICSDKTGTLTKNEMTVSLIYDGSHRYEVTGSGYEPAGGILHAGLAVESRHMERVQKVLRIGLHCNESSLVKEEGKYSIEGDPTEGALLVSALKGGLSIEAEKEDYPQIAMIPFESDRGWMATLHHHKDKKFIFVKGSPENVLAMCTSCLAKRAVADDIINVAEDFARDGLRVLAFAFKEMSDDTLEITTKDVESGVTFAGLQGMIDPPRPEAIKAVADCKEAGIRVMMITGDHAVTAVAIAKKLGIGGENPRVIKGRELEAMSDDELFKVVKDVSVYARVSPSHKYRIVQQLIKHGEVVAVTGDGVNDAPALKAAHIGISMGKGGTDVAKEASDMILTDDNFATIFGAVEEGRVVYDNIRKAVFFLIPTGIAAILSISAAMVLDLPIPYVAAQLLWINLVTNGLQDVALAFEPGEKDITKRPPRNPKDGIMSRVMVERTMLVALLISIGVIYNFTESLNSGATPERARTVAVTTMVFFQFFQAWNSRSVRRSVFKIPPMSNPFLFYSMIAAFFAQLAVVYVPTLQFIFRTEPLVAVEWIRILLMASTVVIVVEIDKWIRRRNVNL